MVETRRQQIEDAASRLFRDRGYAATSVRDIARELDLRGASLYAHVSSKEDVLWAIVCRAAERFHDEVLPIAGDETPAAERLTRMVRAHTAIVTADQRDAAVFLHEWRFLSAARRAQVAARRDAYERAFRYVVAEGVASGEFARTDAGLAATWMLTALNGIAAWYRSDGPRSASDIADLYAGLFVRGLARRPEPPERDVSADTHLPADPRSSAGARPRASARPRAGASPPAGTRPPAEREDR